MAQANRPWIGINTDFVAAGKQARAHFRLPVGYCDAVLQAGGLPIFLPTYEKEADIEAFLDKVDGIMLSGGGDLDPRRMGQQTHSAVQVIPVRRENSDRMLIQAVLKRHMPLLAVGLGMQLLNVIRGGSLYLHLPEDLPRTLPHRDPTGAAHRHAVLLEPGTRMDEIYGGGEIRINSDHHQAVRQLGAGLRLGARSPDGVIEAIEGTDPNHFCIGVQWHPESETASALDMQLFEAFIQACVRQGKTLGMAA
jgi:putative glutamine amidotransferase